MAIVFVHGVANRKSDKAYAPRWRRLELLLRRYIAPVVSDAPDRLPILDAHWGDLGATFAWGGSSRPKGLLLGMGAGELGEFDQAGALASYLDSVTTHLPAPSGPSTPGSGLLPMGAGEAAPVGAVRLASFTPKQLSDLMAAMLARAASTPEQQASLVIAADDVAHDASTAAALAARPDLDGELEELRTRIEQRTGIAVIGMGSGSAWWQRFEDGFKETISRVGTAPGFAVSRLAAEVRGPLNDFVAVFLGDVFTYLRKRGDANDPGEIPKRVLASLEEAARDDGPLVVLSHSMGGQIVYDLVTYFIPALPAAKRVRVDFWCATASQVGLFEELKLFGASSAGYSAKSAKAPHPGDPFLGDWWNVWDYSDFISFTADPIFAEIDDASYSSGMSLLSAHGGYLERPTFFKALAGRLEAAKARGWRKA